MLAATTSLPATFDGWLIEPKWDGVRAVVYVEGGRVRVMSRNDRDVTASYPELRLLGEALGSTACVLDGEIVAFGPEGRPSFGALQQRMHVSSGAQARRLAEQVPATLLLFDVLHLAGHSLVSLPWRERRGVLESLELGGPSWQTPPYFPGNGASALATSSAQGLEGIVAKRVDSAYEPDRRSRAWIKVKNIRTQEVVVGGWKPGEGRRAATIGSLLLGVMRDGELRYAGHVGTGFSEAVLRELTSRLRRLERAGSPFAGEVPRKDAKDARWVEPRLLGEVAYGEWTRDGRLRHPSWRGLRADKSPEEVVQET